VGPGKTYATVCAALAAAANSDTINVDSVDASGNQLVLNDDICTTTLTGLTITGVGGGRPLIRRTTTALTASGAIWYFNPAGASTLTLNNIEMAGAHNLTQDASPIKAVTTTLTFNNVYFHHNDNGFKGTDEAAAGASRSYDLTITNSEIAYNGGLTEGANWTPTAHNIQTGQCRAFTITGSWIHDARGGSGIRSRCNTSMIVYNRLADYPAGTEIYSSVVQPNVICTGETSEELAFPIGGTAYVIGNVIYQSVGTRSYAIIHWHSTAATTGQANSADELYMTNNTVVDALGTSSTVGIWADLVTPSPLTVTNNIFAGFVSGSTVYATGVGHVAQTTPANNQTYTTIAGAGFVSPGDQNYHLAVGSAAINAASTDPGTAHSVNLNPVSNYLHPLSVTARTSTGTRDMGAYESTATLGATITNPVIWADPGATSTKVRWTPALSDTALVGYTLFRNGTIIQGVPESLTGLSFTDSTVISPGTISTYVVSAETADTCGDVSNSATAGRIRQVNTQNAPVLDPAVGWQDLTRTDLLSFVPSLTVDIFNRGGFAYDTQSNRLLLFSNAQTWDSNAVVQMVPTTFVARLANVSDTHMGTGGEITAGGRPNGRQTYGGVAWLPGSNQLFVTGGQRVETGFLQDTWVWTPGTDTWQKNTPTGTLPPADVQATAYDPLTGHVWVLTPGCLDEYDPVTNAYNRAVGCQTPIPSHPHVALDPDRRRLYVCAELVCGYYNLSTFAYVPITDPVCTPLMVAFPGLEWDDVRNVVRGWVGGKNIYTIDPTTNTCSVDVFEGGPGYTPTYEVGSRFQYAQDLNAFLVGTKVEDDFFLLRLNTDPPVGVPPPPTPPRDFYSITGTGTISGKVTVGHTP
jgi:hypothetical protein